MNETLAGINVVFLLFALVVAVLWLLLPFAVFGIKNRLDKMLAHAERVNQQLERMTGKPADSSPGAENRAGDGWG